jgi:DNA-binding MarR family transcriptional regulator
VAGLVRRTRDDLDHRVVHVTLTTRGDDVLASLATEHLEELRRIRRSFADL